MKNFYINITKKEAFSFSKITKDKNPIHFEGLKVLVKSTHGAGDTFAGTFCANLVLGKKLPEAIKIANKKAAEFISS